MSLDGHYCLDANIFITAWKDVYCPEVFPSFWIWLAEQKDSIIMIKPIDAEIKRHLPNTSSKNSNISPEGADNLRLWVDSAEFEPIDLGLKELNLSLRLESKYGVSPTSGGANHTDIQLIAYAKTHDKTIVTLEKRQLDLSNTKLSNYKIPAICTKENVRCIDTMTFLKETGLKL